MGATRTLALAAGACLLVLAACYAVYWLQPNRETRKTGTVTSREFVPSHEVESRTGVTWSHVRQLTGPSTVKRRVPDSYTYVVSHEDGTSATVSMPASTSFEVGDRVAVSRTTRWAPIWGTWVVGESVQKPN